VAEGRRYPGAGSVLPGAVRGANGAGGARRRFRGQVHGWSRPVADGFLRRPRGHQLAVPDGVAPAAGASRDRAPGHR